MKLEVTNVDTNEVAVYSSVSAAASNTLDLIKKSEKYKSLQ